MEQSYELMEYSILKNIQELSELCVDCKIYNYDDLAFVITFYAELLEKAKKTNGKVMVKLD